MWSVIIWNSAKIQTCQMDSSPAQKWNILNWNVRGLNSIEKCNVIRSKIEESSCSIYCIQETKSQHLDPSDIRKFAPKRFNKFAHFPSDGASGGLLIGWNGSIFIGEVIFSSKYALTVSLTAQHNAEKWKITTVYGPCHGRQARVYRMVKLHADSR
jgi:exonuclease III